jgi:hypothetical protein
MPTGNYPLLQERLPANVFKWLIEQIDVVLWQQKRERTVAF